MAFSLVTRTGWSSCYKPDNDYLKSEEVHPNWNGNTLHPSESLVGLHVDSFDNAFVRSERNKADLQTQEEAPKMVTL